MTTTRALIQERAQASPLAAVPSAYRDRLARLHERDTAEHLPQGHGDRVERQTGVLMGTSEWVLFILAVAWILGWGAFFIFYRQY